MYLSTETALTGLRNLIRRETMRGPTEKLLRPRHGEVKNSWNAALNATQPPVCKQ